MKLVSLSGLTMIKALLLAWIPGLMYGVEMKSAWYSMLRKFTFLML